MFRKSILPSSVENEESLIGAILLSNKAFRDCVNITPEMFYDPRYALMFRSALDLINSGSNVDIVTLSSELEKKGVLASAGGDVEVARLSIIVPTATHAKTYAKAIFEMHQRRVEILEGEEQIKRAKDTSIKIDYKNDSFEDSEKIVESVNSEMLLTKKEDIISFGFREIDLATGGIFPTSLTVVAGDTGDGKSEFVGNIVLNASKNGRKVAFFNLENDKGTTVTRFVSGEMSKTLKRIIRPQDIMTNDFQEDREMLNAYDSAMDLVSRRMKNVFTFDNESAPNIDDFEKYLSQVDGVDLVIIDHLHYFSFVSTESEHTQIGRLMRTFRDITKRKKIPIVLVSHLRKRPRKDEDPTFTDLHGSSDIAKEATVIILLNRVKYEDGTDSHTNIILAKNRIGEVTGKWEASFNRNSRSFLIQNKSGGVLKTY